MAVFKATVNPNVGDKQGYARKRETIDYFRTYVDSNIKNLEYLFFEEDIPFAGIENQSELLISEVLIYYNKMKVDTAELSQDHEYHCRNPRLRAYECQEYYSPPALAWSLILEDTKTKQIRNLNFPLV